MENVTNSKDVFVQKVIKDISVKIKSKIVFIKLIHAMVLVGVIP